MSYAPKVLYLTFGAQLKMEKSFILYIDSRGQTIRLAIHWIQRIKTTIAIG